MSRDLIEVFDGPQGKAEVFEVVEKDSLGVEKVRYEVTCNAHKESVLSMGEASVLACELSGDRRFAT
jgi:hypothetical protein